MTDSTADDSRATKNPVDLKALQELDFAPSWVESGGKKGGRESGSSGGGKHARSGERPAGGRREKSGGRESGADRKAGKREKGAAGGGPRREDARKERAEREEAFEPVVQVALYPQDEAFEALVQRLRATMRTYQLFAIARLILEKPERFVVLVSNKAEEGEEPAPLYFSVPGHVPFFTEEEAVRHVLEQHADVFFETETIEVEPPKGNFQMVNRCGVTGELLGPPNYHRYPAFLRRHYAAKIGNMSYDRFVAKIETVKDPEVIQAWLDSMKTGVRYKVKAPREGEPEALDSLPEAKEFLLRYRKDEVVGSDKTVRFAGRDIGRMPDGDLRRSVETYVARQRRFPLETANNLRGRLRRQNFAVYKKGSKGVSYVCAVKRKFRDADTVLSDSIQNLIEFIGKNPEIPASKLPERYLGIAPPRKEPEKPEKAETPETTEKAESAQASEAPDSSESPVSPAAAGDSRATDALSGGAGEAGSGGAETSAADGGATEGKPGGEGDGAAGSEAAMDPDQLSPEDRKRMNQLLLDLRWLVTEGYVTEYWDGTLFAPPPLTRGGGKSKEKKGGAKPETGAPPEASSSGSAAPSQSESPSEPKSDTADADTFPETESIPGGPSGSGDSAR